MEKLRGWPGIRYTDIAAHAQALGRKGLAAMLLEYETIAAEQVREVGSCLLAQMGVFVGH